MSVSSLPPPDGMRLMLCQYEHFMNGEHRSGYLVPRNDVQYSSADISVNGLQNSGLVDPTEVIEEIWQYKRPLIHLPESVGLLFHTFVVIKTNRAWYSLEKREKEILIQISHGAEHVTSLENGKHRKSVQLEYYAKCGFLYFQALLAWLAGEIHIPYHSFNPYFNCQGFAERLFRLVARG